MQRKSYLTHGIIIITCIIALFPVYWLFISSFKEGQEIFNYALWPEDLGLSNYKLAMESLPLIKMLKNSIIVSLGVGLSQMLVGILFAYGLTRWQVKGRDLIFTLVSFAWLVPLQAIMIPNYIEVINMGLGNTLLAIVLPNTLSILANIRMYQAFQSFPRALIEAASLDGANDLQLLKDIILPNLKAEMVSLFVILVISSWNDYLWPMIISSDQSSALIQIGLRSFVQAEGEMWGPAMAAAVLSVLPILILYIFMSRYIIDSFTKGGIK